MVYSDNDRAILQSRINAIQEWVALFSRDSVNNAIGAVNHVVNNDLPEIRRIRWFSVASENELSAIWYRYFENITLDGEVKESVFDFYALGVQYMEMMAPIASGHSEGFQAHLARSITWPERTVVIGESTKDNISSYGNVMSMIKSNPWVMFFIILGMMDVKV